MPGRVAAVLHIVNVCFFWILFSKVIPLSIFSFICLSKQKKGRLLAGPIAQNPRVVLVDDFQLAIGIKFHF